ncbi:uncharacterized protein [Triticum aestivum]|uniref:uncharacterized protein n=1 Tax=Triticum aestivum TaxID=4565 RepID=UPI001D01A377|nr:uncharacterized protein LOC123067557 [Triticum aestivum]
MHQLKDLAGSTESCLREGCPSLLAGEYQVLTVAALEEDRPSPLDLDRRAVPKFHSVADAGVQRREDLSPARHVVARTRVEVPGEVAGLAVCRCARLGVLFVEQYVLWRGFGRGAHVRRREQERALLSPTLRQVSLPLSFPPGLGAITGEVAIFVAIVTLHLRHVAPAVAGVVAAAAAALALSVVAAPLVLRLATAAIAAAPVAVPVAGAIRAGPLALLALPAPHVPLLLRHEQLAASAGLSLPATTALLCGAQSTDQLLDRDCGQVKERLDRYCDLGVAGGDDTKDLLDHAHLVDVVPQRTQLVD